MSFGRLGLTRVRDNDDTSQMAFRMVAISRDTMPIATTDNFGIKAEKMRFIWIVKREE